MPRNELYTGHLPYRALPRRQAHVRIGVESFLPLAPVMPAMIDVGDHWHTEPIQFSARIEGAFEKWQVRDARRERRIWTGIVATAIVTDIILFQTVPLAGVIVTTLLAVGGFMALVHIGMGGRMFSWGALRRWRSLFTDAEQKISVNVEALSKKDPRLVPELMSVQSNFAERRDSQGSFLAHSNPHWFATQNRILERQIRIHTLLHSLQMVLEIDGVREMDNVGRQLRHCVILPFEPPDGNWMRLREPLWFLEDFDRFMADFAARPLANVRAIPAQRRVESGSTALAKRASSGTGRNNTAT